MTAWEILWWGEILEECKKIFNQLITQRHDQMHSANTYIKHRSHMSWALRTSFLFLRQKRNLFKCYSEKNSQAGSNPRKWSMLREDPKKQNEHHFHFISSWPSKWTRHKHRKWNSRRHTHAATETQEKRSVTLTASRSQTPSSQTLKYHSMLLWKICQQSLEKEWKQTENISIGLKTRLIIFK